jgi:hypothetical protein
MAVATATYTQSPYPKGLDMTQRRFVTHGPVTISASPATYPSGGIPIFPSAAGITPGMSNPAPVTAFFQSRANSGFQYAWCGVDLWTAKYKNATVAVGQALIDSNGNTQVCTTGGTAGNGAEPTWNKTIGGTTTDGTVTWTNKGISLGLLQILTGAAAQSPLAELTQAAAIPAGVSGDTIAGQIEFLKG